MWAHALPVPQDPAAAHAPNPLRAPKPLQAPVKEVMRAEDKLWLTRPGAQVVHWMVHTADRIQLAELAAHIEARRQGLPHFDQRIGQTKRGAPCWERVQNWQARDHLRQVEVSADPGALGRAIECLSLEPLPAGKAPWEGVLLQVAGQGSCLVFRTHHAMGDGRSLVELMLLLHDEPAEAQAAKECLTPARKYRGTAQGPLVDGARAIHDTFSTMTHLLVGPPECSPELKGCTTAQQRHAWLGPWSLSAAKAAAHAFGGTLNDLLLTAVAGGVRRYLEQRGEPPEFADLHALQVMAMPRKPGQRGGNAVTAVSTPLPVQSATLDARFEAVRHIMKGVKESWKPEMMRNAQRLALVLPPPLQQKLYERSANQHSVILSNVQGSAAPLRIAGHSVTDMRWFGPAFGNVALQISALSYAGQFNVGVATDGKVIKDAPALEKAIAAAFVEMMEVAATRRPAGGKPALE